MKDRDEPIQSAVPSPGLKPLELVQDLLSRIDQGNVYARSRKKRFRRSAVALRIAFLAPANAGAFPSLAVGLAARLDRHYDRR
jgi:hypothetical protein